MTSANYIASVSFFGVAVLAHFWPTFLYIDVSLGFQKSAVLLDDFISTENVGTQRKSRFRLDEPDTREKRPHYCKAYVSRNLASFVD